MFVDEINAKGGVLGRKIELVIRDTKGNADEAVRIARDLILRENVDFLVGTLTSAEGPAVSPIAKEHKIVFIVPVVKTDQLTAKENLHPYVFRTTTNTTIEGRTAAEIMAKWNVKRVGTMSPDYAFGQDVTRAFVTHLKKIKPDIEIVDQQWPKLGEADYTPFINAQMAKRPDAVFSSLWGGHFVTFAKQAKPLKYSSPSATISSARVKRALSRRRRRWATTTRSESGPIPTTLLTGRRARRRTRNTSRD